MYDDEEKTKAQSWGLVAYLSDLREKDKTELRGDCYSGRPGPLSLKRDSVPFAGNNVRSETGNDVRVEELYLPRAHIEHTHSLASKDVVTCPP